jgi:hypothetical protein
MWYGGEGGGDFQFGYAISTDGSLFDRVGQISGFLPGEVEDDHVVRDPATGEYHMYYWDRNEEPLGLFRASSENETDFDFANARPVTINGATNTPMHKFTHVFQDNGVWTMFYGEFIRPRCLNCRIAYATSSDGVTWQTRNANVLVGQDAEILPVADDLYLMYYGPDGYFDGEGGDVRLAVMQGQLSELANVTGPMNWTNGSSDFHWNNAGNWSGGQVPRQANVFFDFGPARITTAVPPVNDVFVANAVAPPNPNNPTAPTNHTELFVENGGRLTISGGQLKVGAFTGSQSPTTGVVASVYIEGNGVVESRYGVVTNPLFHPTSGNISTTIDISGDGMLDAGTGLFLGGGKTTINLSDTGVFLAPHGIFEHVQGGSSPPFDPTNVNNPYGIDAVINLSGSAQFIVPSSGPFAVSQTLADLYIAEGLISGNGIMHFVDGNNRVFMATALSGDYNGDGTVDAADYVVWRRTGSDQAAYNAWRSNFGATLGTASAAASAPEPAALVQAAAAVGTVLGSLCRRRRYPPGRSRQDVLLGGLLR